MQPQVKLPGVGGFPRLVAGRGPGTFAVWV